MELVIFRQLWITFRHSVYAEYNPQIQCARVGVHNLYPLDMVCGVSITLYMGCLRGKLRQITGLVDCGKWILYIGYWILDPTFNFQKNSIPLFLNSSSVLCCSFLLCYLLQFFYSVLCYSYSSIVYYRFTLLFYFYCILLVLFSILYLSFVSVENCIKDTIDSVENFHHTTCSVPGIYIPNLLAIRARRQYNDCKSLANIVLYTECMCIKKESFRSLLSLLLQNCLDLVGIYTRLI